MHRATHDIVFARTSGNDGEAKGITAFLVPVDTDGLDVPYYHWTFNMPTDHAEVTLKDVRVPNDAIVGGEGSGLACINTFTHENRIRQAASGVGAGQYCLDESVAYARSRVTFGKPLSERQAIQWPLVELQTEAEMLRGLVHKTAWLMDRTDHMKVSDKVSMCNYRANRFVCNAADTAIQVHGGSGYTRAKPFELQLGTSTSTGTTGATASPKDRRRSRSATSPATCSATSSVGNTRRCGSSSSITHSMPVGPPARRSSCPITSSDAATRFGCPAWRGPATGTTGSMSGSKLPS